MVINIAADPGASGGIDLDSDIISELALECPNLCGVKLTWVAFQSFKVATEFVLVGAVMLASLLELPMLCPGQTSPRSIPARIIMLLSLSSVVLPTLSRPPHTQTGMVR